jgi:FixJ family two-component response regulator
VAGAPLVSIVDDDQSVREGIVDLVRAMGFDAAEYDRAEQFLQSGRIASTACLISDMRMPGMTGLELHEQLVASGKIIPTIVITAFPEDVDRARALQSGVICYLAKPFDNGRLAKCIKSALKARDRDLEE